MAGALGIELPAQPAAVGLKGIELWYRPIRDALGRLDGAAASRSYKTV
jgi:hypothetical protein